MRFPLIHFEQLNFFNFAMDNEEKLSGSMAAIFNEFTEYAQADQDIRDQVKTTTIK